MEKYIIIFIILATIYYIQNKLLIEGFEAAPAQSLGGVDDTNAINTLAQIAKQLMAGGITVPGAMTVIGALTVNGGIITPKGTGYRVTSASGQSYGIWGGGGSGFASDNGLEIHTYKPDGGWAGNALNIIGTNTNVNGNLGVGGNINLSNDIHTIGSLSSIGPDKKNKVCLHTPPDGRRALYIAPQKLDGTDWEWGNGLALDFKEKNFNTNSNNLIVGGNLNVGGEFRPVLSEIFRITNQQHKYVLFTSNGNDLNCNGNGAFNMTWQSNPEYFWFQRGARIFNYKYPNKCMTITGDRGWNRDTFVNLVDFDPNNAHQCWTWTWAGCIITSSCSNGEGNPVPALRNSWITKMRCRAEGRIDIWDWNGGADTQFWKW
jgi:hypothetical protein